MTPPRFAAGDNSNSIARPPQPEPLEYHAQAAEHRQAPKLRSQSSNWAFAIAFFRPLVPNLAYDGGPWDPFLVLGSLAETSAAAPSV